MRTIVYITGTRADYGLMRTILQEIDRRDSFELKVVVTGMHLTEEFGGTVDLIKKDKFKYCVLDAVYDADDKRSMATFVGRFVQVLANEMGKLRPDMILILGDRGEMLAGAIVGAYLSIPVVHLHGGEVTSTVDDLVRNAITKLAHIHMPATVKSSHRILRMGEEPFRVFVVGAPGLDSILRERTPNPEELSIKYDLDLTGPILLVLQHPVTLEVDRSGEQMRETLEAIASLRHQTVLVYPNADAGGRRMIEEIEAFRDRPYIKIHRNIPREDFLGLMRIASALVGNSSSGVIEAPSLGLPFVNIGQRQLGRERGDNVIDVGYHREEIKGAIEKALYDEEFKRKVERCFNPYGDGNTASRVSDILEGIQIDEKLLQKRMTY